MWQEYRIPGNKEVQMATIRGLNKWVLELENVGLINGFAFNHYYCNPPERDELRIRFEYSNDESISKVENELCKQIRVFNPQYVIEKRVWNEGTTPENVLRAYEFGSRCAFLLWDLVEKGRIEESWVSDYYPLTNQTVDQFNFQQSGIHGLMNSLGIDKRPNELLIHLFCVITMTESHNFDELVNWLNQCRGAFDCFFSSV
jgi:hypothetical protein